MRRLRLALLFIFGCLLLLWLGRVVSDDTPTSREARAERLIRVRLPPGSDQKRVVTFLLSQDAALATDSMTCPRRIWGSLPLVGPSSWGSFTRWGVPHQWLESYENGVGFCFVIDARGRMVSFKVYPPGAGP